MLAIRHTTLALILLTLQILGSITTAHGQASGLGSNNFTSGSGLGSGGGIGSGLGSSVGSAIGSGAAGQGSSPFGGLTGMLGNLGLGGFANNMDSINNGVKLSGGNMSLYAALQRHVNDMKNPNSEAKEQGKEGAQMMKSEEKDKYQGGAPMAEAMMNRIKDGKELFGDPSKIAKFIEPHSIDLMFGLDNVCCVVPPLNGVPPFLIPASKRGRLMEYDYPFAFAEVAEKQQQSMRVAKEYIQTQDPQVKQILQQGYPNYAKLEQKWLTTAISNNPQLSGFNPKFADKITSSEVQRWTKDVDKVDKDAQWMNSGTLSPSWQRAVHVYPADVLLTDQMKELFATVMGLHRDQFKKVELKSGVDPYGYDINAKGANMYVNQQRLAQAENYFGTPTKLDKAYEKYSQDPRYCERSKLNSGDRSPEWFYKAYQGGENNGAGSDQDGYACIGKNGNGLLPIGRNSQGASDMTNGALQYMRQGLDVASSDPAMKQDNKPLYPFWEMIEYRKRWGVIWPGALIWGAVNMTGKKIGDAMLFAQSPDHKKEVYRKGKTEPVMYEEGYGDRAAQHGVKERAYVVGIFGKQIRSCQKDMVINIAGPCFLAGFTKEKLLYDKE